MAFNINNFRSKGLIYGGARPTQFSVHFFPPFSTPDNERINLLVKATTIPPSTVEPVEVGYFGRKIKVAGDRIFMDWNVTVMNDEDFAIRAILERWSNDINAMISNRLNPDLYALGYKQNAEVTHYGKDGRILRAYRLVGLWPINVDAIGLDWDATNTIEYYDVTFAYDYWEPVSQDSSSTTYSPLLSDEPAQFFGEQNIG